ncbi:hypothetical protein GN956_G14227 [Arapaima gigas]
MEKIYKLLEESRLEQFYNKFIQEGVKDPRDFLDSFDEEHLNIIGLSNVEKRRFSQMQEKIQKLGSSLTLLASAKILKKPGEAYSLTYRFPKCPETRTIGDVDPSQNTFDDLMVRIRFHEAIGNDQAVCLYSAEGLPLTDDPFFNTWCLNDRHIENGAEIYAIFTPKENIQAPVYTLENYELDDGDENVRCHIMLKGDYEIKADVTTITMPVLKKKLSHESGIPAQVLHFKHGNGELTEVLENAISTQSAVQFYLSSFDAESPNIQTFFMNDVRPSVQQTQKGMSVFFATLYTICMTQSGEGFKKVVAYIRHLSGCNPLAQSLHQVMVKKQVLTKIQKVALVEGLYILFRELLPSLRKRTGPKIIEDNEVFEHATVCWAYLMSQAESFSSDNEMYAPISLICEGSRGRLSEPVRVPGIPSVYDRAYVLEKIKNDETIPNCSEVNLRETSVKPAKDVERILLSLPPWISTFPLWISYNAVSGQNFQINADMTFSDMTKLLDQYPHLEVTPPLQLRNVGIEAPRLVFLKTDNLGVYMGKDKLTPQNMNTFDCLTGKQCIVNIDELAAVLRDSRSDQCLRTTRTPQEAILVLLDSSSSMNDKCFDSESKMMRMDAVKQMFHAFVNRTMAYDFHHIVGLVRFASTVETCITFTETLEAFKEHVDALEASGATSLYDALNHGISELKGVKEKFPRCRLRMICLTDGCDVGSKSDPVKTAVSLKNTNIIVDAIIVGEEQNKVLHGISNVTGGCCFKPATLKDGVKLFEMETVLSLEKRTPKKNFNISSIKTLSHLTAIFNTVGYDDKPLFTRPDELKKKVTVTKNVLKKKMKEVRGGRFMEKDRRIVEELKHLHCDPHPYFTILPVEDNLCFWKILMSGPPDTPYENGTFELYCEFGDQYPVKPPVVHFLTPIYHCNINSVGRICHNIFDRNYSAHITMREILDAIFGLLIAPEPEDPLDSVLAEEYRLSLDAYQQKARKATEELANESLDTKEKKLVGSDVAENIPRHLTCHLSKKMFVDPVQTPYGNVYERSAIEEHLKSSETDPANGEPLEKSQLKADKRMKSMVQAYRERQIQETAV